MEVECQSPKQNFVSYTSMLFCAIILKLGSSTYPPGVNFISNNLTPDQLNDDSFCIISFQYNICLLRMFILHLLGKLFERVQQGLTCCSITANSRYILFLFRYIVFLFYSIFPLRERNNVVFLK